MKPASLNQQSNSPPPTVAVTLQIPQDLVDDLQRLAAILDYSDYRELMCFYIAQGLGDDLTHLEGNVRI